MPSPPVAGDIAPPAPLVRNAHRLPEMPVEVLVRVMVPPAPAAPVAKPKEQFRQNEQSNRLPIRDHPEVEDPGHQSVPERLDDDAADEHEQRGDGEEPHGDEGDPGRPMDVPPDRLAGIGFFLRFHVELLCAPIPPGRTAGL